MILRSTFLRCIGSFALVLLSVATVCSIPGCEEEKNTILDVETPGTDIELKESKSDGDLELEIDQDK